ncbi:MAG TPA: cell envelope integrity protein CreD [Cytophagaceae bacterium]|jgi:inner membrane protein
MERTSLFERLNSWARTSITLKLFTIVFLILILLIPSSMISSLIGERETLRMTSIDEVSSKWGGQQTIGGPIISVPYRTVITDEKGKPQSTILYAHFLPESLNIEGEVIPQERHRGIYVVVLYGSKINVNGKFSTPDLSLLSIPKGDFILKDALVTLGISDMKGIRENIKLQLGDTIYSFNPGIATHDIFPSGVSFPIDLTTFQGATFNFKLNLNGSSKLFFLPLGKETVVNLKSPWLNPGFDGEFLPEKRMVSDKGFSANWKVLHLNRNYGQAGIGSFIQQTTSGAVYNPDEYSYSNTSDIYSSFGVNFLLPVDEYQKTMRSAKYGIIFIVITFLTFFFVEVLNRKRIHPIQYLLVGFAICLFYILLISLSEHIPFNVAYLICCLIILLLITFYSKSVLKNNFLTGLIFLVLTILYIFFYSLLQLEDYALLLGSIGLLLVLAIIMYLTRNIDWYAINSEEQIHS